MEQNYLEAAFQANILLCGETFQAAVSYENGGLVLAAGWKNKKHHVLDLQEFIKEIGVELPDFHFCRNDRGAAKDKLLLSGIQITTSTHTETAVLLVRKD